jgi:hypothetical protein
MHGALRLRHGPLLLMPMYLAALWMLLPFAVLIVAPFSLPLNNPLLVFSYVLLNTIFFCVGYRVFGITGSSSLSSEVHLKTVRHMIRVGFWLALLLLPFSISVYTGKSIFDIASVLDQNAVYTSLGEAFEEESMTRKLLSLIRGLVAPVTIAVIPLAAFYWSQLGTGTRTFAVGTVITYMLFSAFRGTDKEMGDLVILSLSGILVRTVFVSVRGKQVSKRRILRSAGFVGAFIGLFVILFVFRKSERMGGFVPFCLYGEVACFEPTNSSELSDIISFGMAMFSAYFVQGYYGLSLALKLDYEWTYGIGHSQPLQSIASLFFNVGPIYERGLMAQLQTVGWHDRFVWSSIFPSLASDITFLGIPFLFLFIGSVYGRSWLSAVSKGRLESVVLFALLTILVIYIPANNQIAQSFDLYFATLFWLFIFMTRRYRNV